MFITLAESLYLHKLRAKRGGDQTRRSTNLPTLFSKMFVRFVSSTDIQNYVNNVHINTRQIPNSSYKYFIEHERDLITLSLQQHKKELRKKRWNELKWNLNITNGRGEREKSFA